MKVMALDGNSLAYRAFYALPEDMSNASGQSTNAVYGFTTMLLNLAKEHTPDALLVVFDRPEPTFRHLAIPEYKAQREKAPDTLFQQLGLIRELLNDMGIRWMELPGFEGDDLIATVATKAAESGHDVIVVTGDRDSYQLVSDPHIRVLYNKRGVSDYALYDEAGIFERTGVTPSQYADYAALRGDPSDNLDGVPGVGEKTAAKLISQYGDLAGVLAHAEQQTPKLRANLQEHGVRVTRNAEMMVLRRDVPIDLDFEAWKPSPDMSAVKRQFEFLEFKTMLKRFSEIASKQEWNAVAGVESIVAAKCLVKTLGEVRHISSAAEAVALFQNQQEKCIQGIYEYVGKSERLSGLAIRSVGEDAVVHFLNEKLLGDTAVLDACGKAEKLVAHDAKRAMNALLHRGVDLKGIIFDTAISAYLVNPSQSSYALKDVCEDVLGSAPSGGAQQDGQFDFGGISDQEEIRQACEETLYIEALCVSLRDELANMGNISLYGDIENPLIRVLAKMEFCGIGVDRGVLVEIRDRLTLETQSITQHLYEVAGKTFNVNSPTQLREILFNDRGLSPGKKTKTGFSTDAATLEKIHDQWPDFIGPLLRYREIEKLRSTYAEGLLHEVQDDERIHATFHQAVARTGRLTSDKPNLHNIPVRTDEGRVFRTAFVAPAGMQFLVADYNQIELRCIAHLSDDPGLVSAFEAGEDIHSATAARVFGVSVEQVTHDQRSKAKMVSYGLAYGMEAYGLSQRLAIGVDEASEILHAYFDAFPRVKNYMDDAVKLARETGYTETLFGRRRPIEELRSDNFRVRQAGERQAMNAAIQGLAADIFKIALVRIDALLETGNFQSRIVLQVHDEVIVEVPDNEMDVVGPLVLNAMKSAASLRVPLEVNAAWGRSWAEAKS
jgi:DNA polymerase-1